MLLPEVVPLPVFAVVSAVELVSVNVFPVLEEEVHEDPDWQSNSDPRDLIINNYAKLQKARKVLNKIYHEEFLTNLISQATSVKDRYARVSHDRLEVGDLVLIKEPLLKPTNFPLAVVQEVISNDLGETTSAKVRKGKSKEITHRHSSSLIPLLSRSEYSNLDLPRTEANSNADCEQLVSSSRKRATSRSKRSAAIACQNKISRIFNELSDSD